MKSVATARTSRAKWEVDRAIHAAIHKVGSNLAVRFELCRLVSHVRAHSGILRAMSGNKLASGQNSSRLLSGLVALAEHHRDWRREVED